MSIRRVCNVICGGLIASLSDDSSRVDVNGIMDTGNGMFEVGFSFTIDVPYRRAEPFERVNLVVDKVEELSEYYVITATVVFSPYNQGLLGRRR